MKEKEEEDKEEDEKEEEKNILNNMELSIISSELKPSILEAA